MTYTQEEQDVINRAEEYVRCVDSSLIEVDGHACVATAERGLEQYLVGRGCNICFGMFHVGSGGFMGCLIEDGFGRELSDEPYSRKLYALAEAVATLAKRESEGE